MAKLSDHEGAKHLVTAILQTVADHDLTARGLGTDHLEHELGAHGGLTKRLVSLLVGEGYLRSTPITNWRARDDHVDIEITLLGLWALEQAPPLPRSWDARTLLHDAASIGTLADLALQFFRAATGR